MSIIYVVEFNAIGVVCDVNCKWRVLYQLKHWSQQKYKWLALYHRWINKNITTIRLIRLNCIRYNCSCVICYQNYLLICYQVNNGFVSHATIPSDNFYSDEHNFTVEIVLFFSPYACSGALKNLMEYKSFAEACLP